MQLTATLVMLVHSLYIELTVIISYCNHLVSKVSIHTYIHAYIRTNKQTNKQSLHALIACEFQKSFGVGRGSMDSTAMLLFICHTIDTYFAQKCHVGYAAINAFIDPRTGTQPTSDSISEVRA